LLLSPTGKSPRRVSWQVDLEIFIAAIELIRELDAYKMSLKGCITILGTISAGVRALPPLGVGSK
jgi:hypothetical protein